MVAAHLFTHYFARRDVDFGDDVDLAPQVSSAGALLMSLTFLAGSVLITAIAYALHVVATLAFIEKELPPADDPATETPFLAEEDVASLARHGAITNSIRKTIRHLEVVGGFWGRWRGFACSVCIQVVYVIIVGLATAALNAITFGKLPYLDQLIASLATSIALCHWRTAWTHIVVSSPSPKKWTQRVPPFRSTVKNVWVATLIHELASRISIIMPSLVFVSLGLENFAEQSAGAIIGKAIPVALVAFVLYVTLAIPATVALTRVQASMLPDEDETIVPFDRSFGGKVNPAIVGGSGALGFMDTWKSLTKQARNRIVKLCIKIVLAVSAAYIVVGLAMAIELMVFKNTQPKAAPQLF